MSPADYAALGYTVGLGLFAFYALNLWRQHRRLDRRQPVRGE